MECGDSTTPARLPRRGPRLSALLALASQRTPKNARVGEDQFFAARALICQQRLLPSGSPGSYSVISVSFVTFKVSPSTVPSAFTCRPFFDLVFFSRSAALVLPASSSL